MVLWDRWRHPSPPHPVDRPAPQEPTAIAPAPGADPSVWVVPAAASFPEPPPRAPAPARSAHVDRAPSPATLKLSQRIILHVYAQGRPTEYVAPASLCQSGMCEALGAPQNHLAKALARLVAGGVLTVSRRHVAGGARRVLVYTLTPLGEALARDLRKSSPAATVSSVPAWMGRP
jgi:DNA-binding MarR family transcriptional regulator